MSLLSLDWEDWGRGGARWGAVGRGEARWGAVINLCGVKQRDALGMAAGDSHETHVLYVRDGGCPGSAACLSVIHSSPVLESVVRVEYVDALLRERQPLPRWLDGSPSLVNKTNRSVLYGSRARDTLLEMRGKILDAGATDATGSTGSFASVASFAFVSASLDNEESDVKDGGRDIDIEGDAGRPKLDDQALKDAMARRSARTKELQGEVPPTMVQ